MYQKNWQLIPTQTAQTAKETTKASRFGTWWQKSELRTWWEENKKTLIIIAIGIIVLLIAFTILVQQFGWGWTGFLGGESKVTNTPQGTTTEYSPGKTLWDWLLLASSLATTSAIVAAGWWFFRNRSLIGEAQVSLSLKDVVIVKGIRIAIVEVRIKNLGRTKIEKEHCYSTAKTFRMRPSYPEDIRLISEGPFDYSDTQEIFDAIKVIEPNEEIFRDIAFALNKTTIFMVSVDFTQKRGANRSWVSAAIFNVDDKAKVPTPTNQSTLVNVKIFPHWTIH